MTASGAEVDGARLDEVSRLLRRAWSRSGRSGASTGSTTALADSLSDTIQLALHNPELLRRLHAATSDLTRPGAPEDALATLLDDGIRLADTKMGNLQLLDPTTGSLHMVAWRGFDHDFVERFSVVDDDSTTSGRAVREDRQVFIGDVDADPALSSRLPTSGSHGYRSVQSTPLHDYGGRTVGVLSTHWQDAGEQAVSDLRLLRLYGDFAGERLRQLLAPQEPPPDDEPSTVRRVVMDALLDPWSPRTNSDLHAVRITRRRGPIEEELTSDPLGHLADVVVTGLFAAGLEIDAARSMAADGPAAARLEVAGQTLNALLIDVREALLGRG